MNKMKIYLRNLKKPQFKYSLPGLVDDVYILPIFITLEPLP